MYGRLLRHTRADHSFPNRQHGGSLVEEGRGRNMNVAASPPPTPTGHPPMVPTLHTLPQLCVDNVTSNRPSHSQDLTDAGFLSHMDASHPQTLPWRLWTPPRKLVSAIASALRQTTFQRYFLIVKPPLTMRTGQSGPSFIETWPFTLTCLIPVSGPYPKHFCEAIPDRSLRLQRISIVILHG